MNAKRWIHILGRDKEKQPGPGVRDEPKSRGKFYRIFKTCFDLQMRARWHKDEIVNVRTWILEGRDGMAVRYGTAAWKKDATTADAHDENRWILLPA